MPDRLLTLILLFATSCASARSNPGTALTILGVVVAAGATAVPAAMISSEDPGTIKAALPVAVAGSLVATALLVSGIVLLCAPDPVRTSTVPASRRSPLTLR